MRDKKKAADKLESEYPDIFKQLNEDIKENIEATRRFVAVNKKFPGWARIVKTEHFRKWVEKSPKRIKRLVYSEKVSDACTLLEEYNEYRMFDLVHDVIELIYKYCGRP